MAREVDESRRQAAVERALSLTTEALDLLDAHGGPPEAAANLELALEVLREARASKP